MAPPTMPCAKITLSYPLYAADFDPQNSDFLLVGGGGGEGRSGVGNKIVSKLQAQKDTPSRILDRRYSILLKGMNYQRS